MRSLNQTTQKQRKCTQFHLLEKVALKAVLEAFKINNSEVSSVVSYNTDDFKLEVSSLTFIQKLTP